MTIVLFIAVLFFLILVHELGHFVTAKWAKMRVDEFAIGFPPRLFSIKKGETEYSVNLLPIGGYVKIFGENGTDEVDGPLVPYEGTNDEPSKPNANNASSGEHPRTGRAFNSRPRLHQAIVLLAGVFMNILAAWIIFFAVAMIGTPTAVDETDTDLDSFLNSKLTVIAVVEGSPAAKAGIPTGAVITNVQTHADGQVIDKLTPSSFTSIIANSGDSEVKISYSHKGSEQTVNLRPEAGLIESDPDRAIVGLSTSLIEIARANPLEALIIASERTWGSLSAITVGLVSFLASAFTLSANIEEVTGPIGIAGMVGEAAEFGFTSLLIFTAFISLNLAVINLLPIPALDGGRLLFVLAEAIIRRPIDPEWMARVNFIGFALLILLMVAVTYNDILRLF